jgi:hypothetical protein
MAIALHVGDVERERLDWLDVVADDGKVYRYQRGENVDLDTPAHLEGHYLGGVTIRAVLARDPDRRPLLRQDEEGLPRTLVVTYIAPTPATPGTLASYWEGKVEYSLADVRESA